MKSTSKISNNIMRTGFLLGVLSVPLIGLTACSSNAGNGALIGALAGAAIGKSTANNHDSRAVIGAVVGGAAGAVVGSQRDLRQPRYHQPRAYQSPYPEHYRNGYYQR